MNQLRRQCPATTLRLLPRAALILLVLAAPVLAMPMMRADAGSTIEAPALKKSRRRLRPAGQPAARLKERRRDSLGAAIAPLPSAAQISIMGHGKANLSPSHRIRRHAGAFCAGRASTTPARRLPRCSSSTTATPSSCAIPLRRLPQRRRHGQALPRLLSRRSASPPIRFSQVDSRQAYGHMPTPGHFSTTITRPDLFESYLIEQLRLIMRNHGVAGHGVGIDDADPAAFRLPRRHPCRRRRRRAHQAADPRPVRRAGPRRHRRPDRQRHVRGRRPASRGRWRRSPRSASTIRCTACRTTRRPAPTHFQNFVLFTNYQFYIDEFCAWARELMAEGGDGYTEFVEPGNVVTQAGDSAPSDGVDAAAPAADAGLSPEEAGPWRHHHGQYRRRPVQRQDDHRPYRRAAAACLADARPLRRPAQHARRWATMCWRMPMCARTTCSTTTCRSGCRSRRWPRSRWRWRRRWPR